ncbi:hypothetical protein PC121_g6661 [Phytophthora cactorum]|nr:hypothetical protein PC121_g6661 [Phytophthora cactorum]KAG4060490.1 hypothetical protein PC123_g4638 [Phytophthora cactorum]
MPHHHVPKPKETSPTVDRLRLQLNRTVRRTVTEAVDAVWVAFKDELAQLAAPPTAPPVDDYELLQSAGEVHREQHGHDARVLRADGPPHLRMPQRRPGADCALLYDERPAHP